MFAGGHRAELPLKIGSVALPILPLGSDNAYHIAFHGGGKGLAK